MKHGGTRTNLTFEAGVSANIRKSPLLHTLPPTRPSVNLVKSRQVFLIVILSSRTIGEAEFSAADFVNCLFPSASYKGRTEKK